MKSSSPPPPSSSSASTSVTSDTPPTSSSSSPLPPQSLQSPELQAEFLRECRNKFGSHSEVSESSAGSSPSSSSSSSPLPPSPSPLSPSSPSWSDSRRARLSLSSPELLSELKDSRTRPLRHVPAHNGLTTVFSGRGRGGRASGSTSSMR